jgi:HD-GYP domain-containing protein (c-di-GMP phosphodiesterase class II)
MELRPFDPSPATIGAAGLLHDLGKLAVPQSVLDDPGPLIGPDLHLVRAHSEIGETLARSAGLGAEATIVRHVHERWDGGGYPDGLAGTAIPVGARIVAACDVWDALRSDRPYRPALAVDVARTALLAAAGTHLDASVVDVLAAVLAEDRS